MEIYSSIPPKFVVGDRFIVEIPGGLYPAPVYSIVLVLISSSAKQTITSTAAGSNHRLVIDTATLPPGRYDYQLQRAGNGGGRVFSQGKTIARPDLATADPATYDGRTHAEKVLEAIEAAIEGRASKTQKSQIVYGVEIQYYSHEQLIGVRARYKSELLGERVASGKTGLFKTIYSRFPA